MAQSHSQIVNIEKNWLIDRIEEKNEIINKN